MQIKTNYCSIKSSLSINEVKLFQEEKWIDFFFLSQFQESDLILLLLFVTFFHVFSLNLQTSGEIGVSHKMTPPPQGSDLILVVSLLHVFTTFFFNLHMLFSQHISNHVYRYTSCSTKLS